MEPQGSSNQGNPSEADLSQDLFYRCFSLNPIPATITTIEEGIIVEVNEAFVQLSGYSRDDVIGRAITQIHLWSDPAHREEFLREIKETGSIRGQEVRMQDASEMIHDCLLFSEIIDYGSSPHILSMAVDITERKQAEKSLLAAESRYRALVENTLNGVTIYRAMRNGEDFEIIDFNKSAERINNILRDKVIGRTVLDVFPGIRESGLYDALRRVWISGAPEYLPVSYYMDERIVGWRENFLYKLPSGEIVSVFSDQSARKKAEEDLNEHRRELVTLLGNLPGMVYHCKNDKDWTMEFVSEGCFALTGYTQDELIDNARISYGRIIHPDDRGMVWKQVQEALGRKEHFQLVYRIITEGKKIKWVWEQGIGVFSPQGDLLSLEGFIADITVWKRVQEELKRSEEKFSKVFQVSPEWVTISTLDDGVYIEVNEAFLNGVGYTHDEVVDHTSLELNIWEKPEDRERTMGRVREQGGVRNEEVRFRTKAGRLRNILWSAEVMDFGGLKCILGVGRDITQYKYLESELQRSQRMEALGRLAGSIAHDFNNLLTAIDGFCDLILLRIDNRESVAKSISKIKGVKSSASSLIKQLLSFSRKQPMIPTDVDLNEVIMSMQDLLSSVMGAKNDMRLVLEQKGCHVLADRSQLEQVIMNLSLNARDAMPRGGTFTLATSRVHIDEESADSYIDLTPGDYVRMIVTDTGNGMDEETASHVFEPFFTTKEDGKGSGLGLTTVYNIMKQSGGSIRLRTEPGKGAIFTIFIPCLKEAGLASRAHTINRVRNNAKDKGRS